MGFWRGRCDPRANERRIEMVRTFNSRFNSLRLYLDSRPVCRFNVVIGCILFGRARCFEEPRPRRRRSPREALPALATRPNDQGPAPSQAPWHCTSLAFRMAPKERDQLVMPTIGWPRSILILGFVGGCHRMPIPCLSFFEVEHLCAWHLAGTRSYNGACDRCFIPGVRR